MGGGDPSEGAGSDRHWRDAACSQPLGTIQGNEILSSLLPNLNPVEASLAEASGRQRAGELLLRVAQAFFQGREESGA